MEHSNFGTAKCNIERLQPDFILFLDTQTVIELTEAKDYYSSTLNNPSYVFAVTETVDSETRHVFKTKQEDGEWNGGGWKETFSEDRLFVFRSGMSERRKDLYATSAQIVALWRQSIHLGKCTSIL